MSWSLMIVAIVGTFTSDIRAHFVPMNNKEACVKAATSILADSKGLAFACISSDTGEVVRITK